MKKIAWIAVLLVCGLYAFAGSVLYETETTIGDLSGSGLPHATLSAGTNTIVHFDDSGRPDFVAYSVTNELGKDVVQGEYGVDKKGLPQNKGRLIFKTTGAAMPYSVFGPTNFCVYHLRYLELTTVEMEAHGPSKAYATKVIAFDNKVETASKTNTFTVPEGGQLVITNGMILFGNSCVVPDYNLVGKESKNP